MVEARVRPGVGMLVRGFGILALGAVFALVVALPAAPAWAQPEAPAEAQDEDDPDEDEPRQAILDTVVVTAQKRAENVQEVPASISTLDTEELDVLTAGGGDVRVLSGRVPSLVLESSFGRSFPRFYIRGLGNTDFDLNASQPVSLIYDEVVLENPIVKGMPVWDVERVEVLRGPQGTLFGRNTPAGIVKFDSKKPTRELDGFVRASLGTYTTGDARAAVGGPLSETLSARLSVLYQTQDDWVDNRYQPGPERELGGYTNSAYRLQFLWEPTDRFDALVNLHGWDVDGTARIFRANILRPGTNDLVPGFEQDEVFHDGVNEQDISARGAVVKLDWRLAAGVVTSVTGFESIEMFSRGDIDGGSPAGPGFIPFPSESADGIPDLEQLTQEVRFATDTGGPVDWLVGVFYFDEDFRAETSSFDSFGGNVRDGFAFQTQQAESWALFGSVDWRATERWTLQAGLRFTTDEKEFSAERPDPTFQTPTVAPIRRSTDEDFTSWNVSATYAVSEEVNVYGRVATGFRAPSIQGRILFCPDFAGGQDPATNCVSVAEEEEILSYEVGVKSELLDRRLRLNLTGYWYDFDNQQVVAVGGQFNTATLLNADKTEGYGFEADVRIAPTPEWLVTLGLSNNHTEIQDPGLLVGACAACTLLDPVTPAGLVRVDGNSLPHAPEWIVNGIVDYRRPVRGGLFVGSFDWAYHDTKQFFLYESAEFRADSLELGLRFGYVFGRDGRFEAGLYGRNITDEEIVQNGIDFNNLTGMTNEPALWGVELITRF